MNNRKIHYAKILTVISIFSFLLLGCVKESADPVSEQMKADLKLLPDQGNGLVYINLKQIINSPFSEYAITRAKEEIKKNKEYKDFSEKTGFNLFTDINRAYIILQTVSDNEKHHVLGMAKGTFTPDKIVKYTETKDDENKISKVIYNGKTIYLVDEKYGFTFPDNSTIYFGIKSNIEKAIDVYDNPNNSNLNWINSIKNVKYKSGFFVTARIEKMLKDMAEKYTDKGFKGGMTAIKSLENIYFSLDLSKEFKFDGKGIFNDSEKAELFYDAGKGMWSAAKLSMSDDRDAIDIANKVNFSLEDKIVSVDVIYTLEEVKKLMEISKRIPHKIITLK